MNREELLAPEQYNIVSEFEKFATGDNRKALIYVDSENQQKEVTYDELIQAANRTANVLTTNGLKKGDVVLVMVPRMIEAYVTYIAALKAGLVVIPSSEMLRSSDIEYRIEHSDAKAIIAFDAFTDQLEQVSNLDKVKVYIIGEAKDGEVSLSEEEKAASSVFAVCDTLSTDIAFLSYTSGTTGKPKGVVHTHGWGYAHLRTTAPNWLGIEERDIVWATAAPGWQKWIWTPFLSVLGSGATGFVYNGKFKVDKYLKFLDQYKVNVLCCTPTEYRFMAKAENLSDYSLSSLKSAVSAGEPLNREVIDTFNEQFSLNVRDGYGQTENTLLVGTMIGMKARPGSMGKPTPGNIVDVITADGKIAKVDEVGDIAVHKSTPALFQEYLNDPERTKMQFRGDYYITGDRAKKDAEGYFWFEGRGDDIIVSSGYTIGPFEVEDALIKHPAVRECAVVASPDPERGNIVKAFVVLRNPVPEQQEHLIKELQNHVKELTAPYKYPRKIEFLEELPKTTSGKIMRVELRKTEQNLRG
ncbi:AMP-binding protein [Sporosarcina sp. GW1-11]|uniref:acyl-CoA synthetase MbcS n=1 Tax=Sporosarcina sp. GW1-11 TaxID=2899126 RepID=UPI00294C2981|nr:AMP-binding protein [Sporosarcina sp. GW1-11]MDV6377533.1 AMP-binding protein [Sporosarcina sp. GW1-11]